MKKTEIQAEKDKLYEHLMEAYELAGSLRDSFSSVEGNQGALKEHCNTIRGKIYELRELRGKFQSLINSIKD